MVLLILGTIIVVWCKSIVNGYVDSFICRGDDIAEAMDYNEGLVLSDEESAKLESLQSDWDYFKNSHLWDSVTTTTEDNLSLSGSFYNAGSDTTVIVFYQFDQTKEDDFLYGSYFGEQGYNILLTDMRNEGDSEGEYTGYGYLEQQDVTAWVDYLKNETADSKNVILYGEGMGANAVLIAAGSGNLDESVKYIVAESPYGTLKEEAIYTLKTYYKLSKFPFYDLMQLRTSLLKPGYEVSDVDVTTAVSNATIPVLFLMGTQDDYIPSEYTQEVYDAYPAEKELISADVRHGLVYAEKQSEIETLLDSWN